MKKLTVILMSIVLVAVGAIFVIGQTGEGEGKRFGQRGGHQGHGRHGQKGIGKMLRGLDLTDAQKEQVKAIHQASVESTKSLRDQMKANRDQLEQLNSEGAFNEAAVQAIAQKQGALHAQMIVEREKVKSLVFAILTPEQKAKAAEMKENFKQKMQERKAKFAERNAEKGQ